MNPDLRSRIEALGCDLTPGMVRGTQTIFTERFPGMDGAVRIERDRSYGPHERHRLDIFRRDDAANAPVLVFVHGGGFVMGDKRSPDTPFYDNVGNFAATAGMIGVTMTYRLAPASTWPSGPDDMAAAIDWLHDNIADYGGDPSRIYLMGQSAGAVHVASYVAHRRPRVAGALMISAIYDVAAAHANQFHKAYYGEDESAYPAASTQDALIASAVPLLFSISEFDIADFRKQAAALVGAYGARCGSYPRMLYLAGHNHLSPVLAIGGPDDTLGPEILDFVAAASKENSHG
jgi:triacylglycerol lipase